jgi:hypothetical protein
MAYLILSDYYSQIQIQNLLQVIGSDFTKLTTAGLKAQEQCVSYLTQKYDTAKEFTNTNVWSPTQAYGATNRFYLDAAAYVPATGYVINNLTLQNSNVYICTGATTGVFDITKWALLGAQNTIFYAQYPNPIFNYKSTYKAGDKVFWNGKVYTAILNTLSPSHDMAIQYPTYHDQPLLNVFPDDVVSGLNYWGPGVAYTILAGTLPTNATYYTNGDNRSQQLLEVLIDVTLYKIHSRISPRNIPDLRVLNYQHAIEWLKDCGTGKVTPNLAKLQPYSGARIRYGGNVKLQNNF